MKRKPSRGAVCVALGLAALGLAGVFAAQNAVAAARAQANAQALLAQAKQLQAQGQQAEEAAGPGQYVDLATAMAAVQQGGLLGVITVPGQDLELPVQSTYSDQQLQQAPCRYQGKNGEIARLVICGHNYKAHFGRLSNLQVGDPITLTAMDGTRYDLQVSEVLTVGRWSAQSLMEGKWDLSLFTCTLSGQNRILLRCTLANSAQLAGGAGSN